MEKIKQIGFVFLDDLQTEVNQNGFITTDIVLDSIELKEPVSKDELLKIGQKKNVMLQVQQDGDTAIVVLPNKDQVQTFFNEEVWAQCLLQIVNTKDPSKKLSKKQLEDTIESTWVQLF